MQRKLNAYEEFSRDLMPMLNAGWQIVVPAPDMDPDGARKSLGAFLRDRLEKEPGIMPGVAENVEKVLKRDVDRTLKGTFTAFLQDGERMLVAYRFPGSILRFISRKAGKGNDRGWEAEPDLKFRGTLDAPMPGWHVPAPEPVEGPGPKLVTPES